MQRLHHLHDDDASQAKRPGIIVVHEWWGITPHVREEARRLASSGYTAFVADMYGDGKIADNPKDAGALAGSVRKDAAVMRSRFEAAQETLGRHATVDPKKVGAIGFCFGGLGLLDLARSGAPIAGVASFHGLFDAPDLPPQPIAAKVVAYHGWDDPMVPPDAVVAGNNLVGVGALQILNERGLTPAEFGIAVIGDLPFSAHPEDEVPVVHLPTRTMGTTAGALLLERIASHTGPGRLIVIPGELRTPSLGRAVGR